MSDFKDPLIGLVLAGRFEILDYVAAGGMGRVYRANQLHLDREVAIKLMDHGEDDAEEFQKRFYLEASLCARLSHPNIIRIFDYGCHDDSVYFIAMEFLKGNTLQEVVNSTGPLTPRRAISLINQVCAALVEAHAASLVHRDLKPSNLFVVTDGLGQEHLKILDFGVVKQINSNMEVTHVGGTLGSPWYMSPEQIEDTDIDTRSDLYTLGVILYQLLTGQLPFMADEPIQVLMKHLTKQPPPFSKTNPNISIPAPLEALTLRALKKNPDARFQSAREFLKALREIEATLPPDDPTAYEVLPQWTPDPSSLHEITDMPTQDLPVLESPSSDRLSDEALEALVEATLDEDDEDNGELGAYPSGLDTGSIAEMREGGLDGFVAYVDFNCPYCFALHERVNRWGLADKVEWRMIEHSGHILNGPFDLIQEQMLSTEVVEVHHRAPDVQLELPSHRCRSTTATRLQTYVQREFIEKQHEFRLALFRALWQDGKDIGEESVLGMLSENHDIPPALLEFCEDEPQELKDWQKQWEDEDFDFSIPVLTHPGTDRVLIGLPDERTMQEFFLGERSRVLDSGTCYYQQQPTLLISGWMSHIWSLLSEVKGNCEILQAPTPLRVQEFLSEIAVPDLLIVEAGHTPPDEIETLAKLAQSRSVPFVVASKTPSSEEEVQVLSMGAVEYLPVTGEDQVARARLNRVLRDRYKLERRTQEIHTDTLTELSSRHSLLEQLRAEWARGLQKQDSISFVLLDLDDFKAFNRTHGYLAGNEALKRLAQSLSRAVRGPGCMLARFSGNEFAALLPGYSSVEARDTAHRLQETVAMEGIENNASHELSVLTASVGFHTLAASEETSLYTLVDGASRHLRKSRGRA